MLSGCVSIPPSELAVPNCIKFRTVKNIPVIEGRLNGKPALFIIDTGASVSILNKSDSRRFGFRCTDSAGHHVAGLGGGNSEMNLAINCEVEFGTMKLRNVRFHAKGLGRVVSVISAHEGVRITGIIGANIIEQYKITIDYKNRTISF